MEAHLEEPRILQLWVDTCNADLSVSVEETYEEVRIAVTEESDPSGGDCADGIYVALARPLGDRTVIDEHTDAAVAVDSSPDAG
jgi:hypothetical protein